jgi:hypothetical protein
VEVKRTGENYIMGEFQNFYYSFRAIKMIVRWAEYVARTFEIINAYKN